MAKVLNHFLQPVEDDNEFVLGGTQTVQSNANLNVEAGGTINIEASGALQKGGVEITSTAAELNQLDGGWVSFTTATTPASGSCAVQLVFKDGAGVTMAVPVTGTFYVSKVATGLTVDALGTSVATLTNGVVTNLVTKSISHFVTDATGKLGITLTNGSADSFWLVFKNPGGELVISDECVENA